jgi:hypothetical protein
MKAVFSPVSSPNPVDEAKRLLESQMRNPPKWGIVSIKIVYHGGEARRIVVNRKTSSLLDVQGGQQG